MRAFTASQYAAGGQGSCQECCDGHDSLGGAAKDNGRAKHQEHVQETSWHKVPVGTPQYIHKHNMPHSVKAALCVALGLMATTSPLRD
jgi:hypothetical protein